MTQRKRVKRWSDKTVVEFVKVATQGSYGNYSGCRTIQEKIKRFKELRLGAEYKPKTLKQEVEYTLQYVHTEIKRLGIAKNSELLKMISETLNRINNENSKGLQ